MKRTLYPKLVIAWLLFGVLSFISVATITSKLIGNHLIKTKTEGMYREANVIAAGRLAQTYEQNASLQDIYTNMLAIASCQSMHIWLIDNAGQIVIDTDTGYDSSQIKQLDSFDPAALSGSYYQTGRFFDYFDEDMLSVVAPISSNYTTKGYIAIHYEKSKVENEKNAILNSSYITLAVILLLSLIVMAAFTLIVFLPIHRIIRGADEYAAGNLNYKIPVESSDEIGYLAASMNYMAGEINKAGEYQRKFVSNISHDFRSPLTSIKGYAEAMLDGTIPAEMQEKYLKIVLSETERLTKLTKGLLTLNNFDDKGTYLELSDFDINETVRQTVETFRSQCWDKHISFQLIFEENSLYVNADMSKIQQVLYNLIDNAVKFSFPNSCIYISTLEKHEKVFVSVKDTGEGIPKESINKIWERFYKSDSSRGKDKKGTGLGLSIVKEIIQAHNENINVVSTKGVGTEFTFSLVRSKKRETE